MEKKNTFCAFCSMQCDLKVRMPEVAPYFTEDGIMQQDFDTDNVNQGSICAKGNFTVDYINHPERLSYAERRHNRVTTEEAFDRIKAGFSRILEKHGKDSIGIIANGNVSREEITWLERLARDGFNTKNLGFFLPDDGMVAAGLMATGYKFDRPSIDDLEKADNALIVGDAFFEHPVLAKKVLQARYESRKHMMVVVDPYYSNTAWFADVHLQCFPGAEGLVLMALASLTIDKKDTEFTKMLAKLNIDDIADRAGVKVGDLKWAADIIKGSENLSIIISDIIGKIGQADVCAAYCNLIAEGDRSKRHFYPVFINQSVYPIASLMAENNIAGAGQVLDGVNKGKIKGLLVLGVDLSSSFSSGEMDKALKNLEFLCCSETFINDTTLHADIVLPAANPLEKEGTFTDLDGKNKIRDHLINPPSAGMADVDIIKSLYTMFASSEDMPGDDSFEDLKEIPKVDSYEKIVVDNARKLQKFNKITTGKYPFAFISKALATHWSDGSLTRKFIWNKENADEPVFEIHPSAAEKLNIKEGQKITVESQAGRAKLPVLFSERMQEDMVAACYHWSDVRRIFPLDLAKGTGEISNEPIPVQVRK